MTPEALRALVRDLEEAGRLMQSELENVTNLARQKEEELAAARADREAAEEEIEAAATAAETAAKEAKEAQAAREAQAAQAEEAKWQARRLEKELAEARASRAQVMRAGGTAPSSFLKLWGETVTPCYKAMEIQWGLR